MEVLKCCEGKLVGGEGGCLKTMDVTHSVVYEAS